MAQFTNQAQIRYGNAVANSNIAVGEILEVLSASKTAVRTTYGQNDSVTYIVSIVNAGTVPVTGLTLSDNLGAYTFGTGSLTPLTYVEGTVKYYVNGTLQTAPAVTAAPVFTITGITVPAGGNAMIIYEAMVNQYAPLDAGSSITNNANISGGGITPVTVDEIVSAQTAPLLTITKSISPVPVTENGTITYTFLIQNGGSADADAASGVTVSDNFDPVLTNLTATYNGTPLVPGTDYTYNETSGEFVTTAGRITVPAAAFTQDATTGIWAINPGVGTLVVTGTV